MANVINVSLSRPGAGKTKTACVKIRYWVSLGLRVLIVVPTMLLADQLCNDLSDMNPCKIDCRGGFSPVSRLNKYLDPDEGQNLIVCQQATFCECGKEFLNNWRVVVDELPTPMFPFAITIRQSQLKSLPYIEISEDRRLSIADGCKGKARDWSCGASVIKGNPNLVSMASQECQQIYKAVLQDKDVYVTEEGETNNCILYYAEEFDFFSRFKACSEVHILSATWQGSLFAWFSLAHGFEVLVSELTPDKPEEHKQKVTIYPLLQDGQCSKSVLNSEMKVQTLPGEFSFVRNIQLVADVVKEVVGEEDDCLIFVQDWAKLNCHDNFTRCPTDSRGLNSYSSASNVFCMFHGNHVTTATMCFKRLAVKYGKSYSSLRDAWTQTFLYDATLQNAYRCSLRDKESVASVRLFVQTYMVADYLKRTYLYDAVIDTGYTKSYGEQKKRGPKPNLQRDEAIRMLESGFTVVEVMDKFKLPKSTVKNYKSRLKKQATNC
ncbi:DEAD/DEAH box helicase family protein [Pseudomonas simiae]|uniref:DEAD/DEAH box helicase family protein n=1 Tax=Pseudomonas simiae TaxID=321846 RepID=UPI000B33145E|nr:DEAD/DEAH box helicase family protein [Pseudomonas simiae]